MEWISLYIIYLCQRTFEDPDPSSLITFGRRSPMKSEPELDDDDARQVNRDSEKHELRVRGQGLTILAVGLTKDIMAASAPIPCR